MNYLHLHFQGQRRKGDGKAVQSSNILNKQKAKKLFKLTNGKDKETERTIFTKRDQNIALTNRETR